MRKGKYYQRKTKGPGLFFNKNQKIRKKKNSKRIGKIRKAVNFF